MLNFQISNLLNESIGFPNFSFNSELLLLELQNYGLFNVMISFAHFDIFLEREE